MTPQIGKKKSKQEEIMLVIKEHMEKTVTWWSRRKAVSFTSFLFSLRSKSL